MIPRSTCTTSPTTAAWSPVDKGYRVPFRRLGREHAEWRHELVAAFESVLESGTFVLGEQVEEFEREFARYCDVRHCVGVGSGLDAITLILRALNIGAGDEVIVPSNTFIATWLAVSLVGATPVPVDPDPANFNIDPGRVADAITEKTRAVVAVHLYGRPAPMRQLAAVVERSGVTLIEDAAQAHGARSEGRPCGGLARAAAFSFYPVKNLGALGDAGAVTTDDDALAGQIRELRSYGGASRDHVTLRGCNSRLDELQAAFLRSKLPRLDADNKRRSDIAAAYLTGLADTSVVLPDAGGEGEHAWHLFVVRSTRRDELRAHLAHAGIETLVHYPVSPHLQPAFAEMGFRRGSFPIAELLQEEVLSLPLSPSMTDSEAGEVVGAVRRFR